MRVLDRIFKPRVTTEDLNDIGIKFHTKNRQIFYSIAFKSKEGFSPSGLINEISMEGSFGLESWQTGSRSSSQEKLPFTENNDNPTLNLIKRERISWLNNSPISATDTCELLHFKCPHSFGVKKAVEIREIIKQSISHLKNVFEQFNTDLELLSSKEISAIDFTEKVLTSEDSFSYIPQASKRFPLAKTSVILRNANNHLTGMDLFNTDSNYNAISIFSAGAGSHFFHSELISQLIHDNGNAFIFDTNNAFQYLCKTVGGVNNHITIDKVCLNPFYHLNKSNSKHNSSVSHLLRLIVENECGSLTDFETYLVIKSLDEVINNRVTEINLTDIVNNFSNEIEHLKVHMATFTTGKYSGLFNGKPNIEFCTTLTVFNLVDYKNNDGVDDLIIASLLELTKRKTGRQNDGNKKSIIFLDHAQKILTSRLELLFESISRTARMDGTSIVAELDGVGSLIGNKAIEVLSEYSNWRIFGKILEEEIYNLSKPEYLHILGECSLEYFRHSMKDVRTCPKEHTTGLFLISSRMTGRYQYQSDPYGYFIHGYIPDANKSFALTSNEYHKVIEEKVFTGNGVYGIKFNNQDQY